MISPIGRSGESLATEFPKDIVGRTIKIVRLLFLPNLFLSTHPPNRRLAGFKQIFIGFGEMFATEEAGVGGEGGRVRSFKDEVLADVYKIFFFLGEFAPEEKNDIFSFVGKRFNSGVGQFFPTDIAMRGGIVSADGQNGIK